MAEMCMDARAKLRRYCFLGSMEPVYIHLRGSLSVEKYWPIISGLIKGLDDMVMITLLRDILNECPLIRRDEVIFVYATYLAADIDITWKTGMRVAFPCLIRTDEDLFMFCKYATLIGKLQNRKGFSRTVRKAIKAWYEMQTPVAIRTMWTGHRGLHGFTHKALIKLCHITDESLGAPGLATPFFKTCTELIQDAETLAVVLPNPDDEQPSVSKVDVVPEPEEGVLLKEVVVAAPVAARPEDITTAVSKLRITKKNHDALKIIRKFKLPYHYVPGHLLRYGPIMAHLVPTMSYLQVLKCWRSMAKNKQLDNARIFKLCKARLENQDLARNTNVHPVHILMNLRNIGVLGGDISKIPAKKVKSFKMEYLDKLYRDSFQWQTGTGNLRMHITLNLQSNYKKKFLKNHRKLTYYDACLALSFGYAKREALVDVFHWYEDKTKLKQIIFTRDATTQLGFASHDVVENVKNCQRLVTPIMNALSCEQVYDIFLCIVPTAGRGNPKQNSDFLCKFLDKYRETKNPRAKFIILDLLKYKRSMTYSDTRSENILEICGLDEHTPDLIHNFATHRFD